MLKVKVRESSCTERGKASDNASNDEKRKSNFLFREK